MAVIYLKHPDHGCKVATMEQEALYDEGNGWKRFDPSDPLDHDHDGKKGGSPSGGTDPAVKALREEYEAKFGKRPFNGWNAEKLREMLA